MKSKKMDADFFGVTHQLLPLEVFNSHCYYRRGMAVGDDVDLPEGYYLEFFEKYEPELLNIHREIRELWSRDVLGELGHDWPHVFWDDTELLHMKDQGEMKTSLKRITSFGVPLHDPGRAFEEEIDERLGKHDFGIYHKIKPHAAYGKPVLVHFTVDLVNKLANEKNNRIKNAGFSFLGRLGYCILYHSGKNETIDPAIHLVQSADRLAGQRFSRLILADGVLRTTPLYPDLAHDYSERIPSLVNLPWEDFENASSPEKSWTSLFHYVEFQMRYTYPVSDCARALMAEKNRQFGIILVYLCGGEGTELYKQSFAPELGRKSGKKRISSKIWKEIRKGPNKSEKELMEHMPGAQVRDLWVILGMQESPGLDPVDDFEAARILSKHPKDYNEGVINALKYAVARSQLDISESRALLEKVKDSEDPFEADAADILLSSPLFKK
jgi:hypothetical protein